MTIRRFVSLVMVAGFLGTSAFAAKHTYQVTGPILEVSDSSIVVKKGGDSWEIARSPSTETKGELEVGNKVTVEYTMTATHIEAKPGKKKKK